MNGDVVVEINRVVKRAKFRLTHASATIVEIKNTSGRHSFTANADTDLFFGFVTFFTWVDLHFFAPWHPSATRNMSYQNWFFFFEHDQNLLRQINLDMAR